MLSSLGVTEALGQAKINDVDIVLLLADANEEVIRLNVSMEEVPGVNELDPLKLKQIIPLSVYHLVSKHEDCLKRELALAVVEKIFQGGSKKVNDHDIVVSFHSEPVDVRDAD